MDLLQLHQKLGELERRRAQLTIDAMATIQVRVDTINAEVRRCRADMDAIVSRLATAARTAEKKPTGVVNFTSDGVKIKHTQSKTVNWDQELLAGIVERIDAGGDDSTDYVKTTYKVEEKKFASWPKRIQKVFLPARTFKPGKPSYQISIPVE